MRLSAILTALCLALAAAGARAEQAGFTVSLRGLNAGVLSFSAEERDGRYAVRGEARPAGLARMFYSGSGKATAAGRVDGNRYFPTRYTEAVTKKGKIEYATFTYSNGVPKVTEDPPDTKRKSYHAKPADQKGTVDLLTMAYALLRDRPADLACKLDLSPYDGREVTRIRMSGGKRKGDQLICPGTYSRIAGFSPEDMAEKIHWPFTVYYRAGENDIYRVERMDVPTTLGTVVFRRD